MHVFLSCGTKDVDARDKRGHDYPWEQSGGQVAANP
jgi:hypothetical protein